MASPFVLGRLLGEGAMGQVFEAEDTRLGRTVALKLLHPGMLADSSASARLLREAQAGSSLSHPNVARIYGVEEIDRRQAIVMEFVEGESLRARLARGPLLAEEAVDLGLQALAGLAAAHAAGIIHRDVKPDNLLIRPDGCLKITDFGLAKILTSDSVITQDGQWVGTPAYMAPEQLLGAVLDGRADLFSLGATLFEAVCGRRPFVGDSELAVLYSIINEDPTDFADLGVSALPELERVLRMALRKEPELRYASAEAMAADLELVGQLVRGEIQAAPGLTVPALEVRISGPHTLAFVARTAELETLAEALRHSGGRGLRVVLLAGEAGAGKSRLATEALERANYRGRQRLIGRASPEARTNPYGPFSDALTGHLKGIGVSTVEQLHAYAASRPDLSAADLPGLEALLFHAGGVRPASREQLWGALRSLLRSIADERPTALLIEDLHWADAETWALLAHLARADDSPTLAVVATYRPEDLSPAMTQDHTIAESFHELKASARCRELPVSRLDSAALGDLLQAFLPDGVPSEPLLEMLQRQSEGNIFMALEFLRYLSEENLLTRHDGAWDATLSKQSRMVPPRVQDLVLRRVSRLTPELRELLEVAAVAGEWFHASTLAAATDGGRLQTLRRLQALEREHRLVWAQEGRYRFDHARVRDVLYESLEGGLRQELHDLIGRHMLEEFGEVREYAGAIARHLMQSGQPREALPFLLRAADNARRLFANQEAMEAYREILRVVDSLPAAHREAQADSARAALAGLGDVEVLLGEYASGTETFDELRRAAVAAGDAAREAAAWLGLGTIHERQSRYDESADAYRKSAAIARGLGDREQEGWALAGLGSACLCKDEYPEAEAAYLEALAAFQSVSGGRGVATCLNNLGHVHLFRAEYKDAASRYEEALALRRSLGDRRGIMAGLNNVAHIYTALGRTHEAARALEEGIAEARDIGDRSGLAILLYNRAKLLYETGQYLEAVAAAELAGKAGRALGDVTYDAGSRLVEGAALARLGETARARERLTEAVRLSQSVDNKEDVARAQAELSATLEDRDAGRRMAAEASELARRIGSPGAEMSALDAESRLCLAAGLWEEASRLARSALELARAHTRPFELARAALTAAEAERALGHAGEARAFREEAVSAARRAGLMGLLEEAEMEPGDGV